MIEIEITNRDGNRYGDGPIINVETWEHTSVLDGAGTGRFIVPAADRRTQLIQQRRYARAYAYINGVRTLLDEMIINASETRARSDGMATMTVDGDDILAELANRTVGELSLHRDIVSQPISVHRVRDVPEVTDILAECYDGNLTSYFEFSWPRLDVNQYVYVVGAEPFDFIRLHLGFPNYMRAEMTVQYYKSSAWVDFDVDDQTNVDGMPMHRNGDIVLDGATDWTEETLAIVGLGDVSGYWARIYWESEEPLTPGIRWNEVQLIQRVGTTDALTQILAFAPTDWGLTAGGRTRTSNEVLLQFAGESVLEALIEVAAHTGNHFYRGEGRSVVWLWPDDLQASNIRAVYVDDPIAAQRNDSICLIQNLSMTTSSVELVTRIYPQGADGVRLTYTTRTDDDLPAGYVMSTTANYVENRARIDELGGDDVGLVERWWQRREIAAASQSLASRQAASDALLDAALEELRVRSGDIQACSVDVVKLYRSLQLGQTVQVVYDEWRDGYHSVAVNASFYVLGMTQSVDASGVRVVGLDLATIDRPVAGVNRRGGPALVIELAKQLRHLMTTQVGVSNTAATIIASVLSNAGGNVRAGLVEIRDQQNDPILRASHDDQVVAIGPATRRGWMYDGDRHYATPDVLRPGWKVGFFDKAALTKQTVEGDTGDNEALKNLLDALDKYGLIEDSTT